MYGKTWSRAVPVIAVLAPVGMVQSINAMCGSIYKSLGRTRLFVRVEAAVAVVTITSFWVGLHWGIVGVAAGYAVAEILVVGYPTFAIPLRLLGLGVTDLARAVWRPLTASAVMAASLFGARLAEGREPGTVGFLLLVSAGAAVYLAVSAVVNRPQLRQIIRLMRPPGEPERVAVAQR